MKTLLLFLSLIVTTSQAATVRLYFTDPLTNDKDTNAFYITPIGTNVLSSGGVVGRGVTTRYVPASNGYRTNTLAVGHYSITNRSLGSGVVIRVPDSSSLYDYTNILISGYNIFVTITNGDSGTSGALTNNDTRIVALNNQVVIGGVLGVDDAALTITNGDLVVSSAGKYFGNGSTLTNLHGSNSIAAGTIDTNKMDATAYAAFVGGGTTYTNNTGLPGVVLGSGIGTNMTTLATQAGLAAGSYAQPHSVWLAKPSGLATNYSSLSAAKTASTSGDVITATALNVGATNLLKNGVDYSFQGVTLTHSNQIPESAGLSLGIFDDRGQGALTNTVKGIKLIDYRSQVATSGDAVSATNPFVNVNAFGAIYITNPAANIRIDVDKITHSIVGNFNGSAAIFVHDCTNTEFNVGEIIDPLWLSPNVFIGIDEFDGDLFYQSSGAGVYWHHGDMTVNVGTIKGYGYGFYANATGFAGTDPARHIVENYWMTADEIVSSGQAAIYTVGNTNKYRMWITAKEVRSIAGQAITLFGSQRFYLNAQKISTDASGVAAISLGSNGSPEAWIVSEKVTCTDGNFVLMTTGQTGTLDITAQHYEDVGTVGGAIGFRTVGGTNIIHGGRAKIGNGKGISHEGGRTFAENLYVDTATTTNTANNPVFVKAAGLILKDCVLFAPAGAQCLAATNAQTVTILGTVMCNQTNSSNITFVGGGTLITNTAMIRL